MRSAIATTVSSTSQALSSFVAVPATAAKLDNRTCYVCSNIKPTTGGGTVLMSAGD